MTPGPGSEQLALLVRLIQVFVSEPEDLRIKSLPASPHLQQLTCYQLLLPENRVYRRPSPWNIAALRIHRSSRGYRFQPASSPVSILI